MTEPSASQPLGCEYCKKQSPYWIRSEWRYVDLIGSASANLQVGRCPKCGTYYMQGLETWGRPNFVKQEHLEALLAEVSAYESSRAN
jgi:hypothetical protein